MNYKTIVTAISGIVLVITAIYAIDQQRQKTRQAHADLIVIDSMKSFGKLERPGVTFLHDKHTKALEEQGKDCTTCHQKENDTLVYAFMRTEELSKEETLALYHDNCIGCHEETAEMNRESGPVECGLCHQWEPEAVASRANVSFDPSLHYRHIEAENDQCSTCHHVFDEAKQQLVYQKGAEDSCKTCHKDQPVDKTPSYQMAAHQSCIGCHQEVLSEGSEAARTIASVQCASCHDGDRLNEIEQLAEVPRLDMDQPDLTFVKSFEDADELMAAVVFDHKAHESSVESCRSCHHETLQSCESCHSFEGKESGDFITLAQAMHNKGSDRSCIGCHADVHQEKECAGCHNLIKTEGHISDSQSCDTCHAVPIETIKAVGVETAAQDYQATIPEQTPVNMDELPTDFVIDVIANEYQGVHFPHQAIVASLMDQIQGSTLAANFHKGEKSICQGCHHNSQDNLNPPPRCISCHASSQNEAEDDLVPDAKAAYHRQCFECHDAMEIEYPASTDCVACHQKNDG